MKKIMAGLLLMSVVFVATAQKTVINDANAEKRNVPGFTGISVSSAIDIYLTQGNEDAIAVSASETRYRDRIKTEVKDGVLTIWYDNEGFHWSTGHKKMKAYISFKNINKLIVDNNNNLWILSGLGGALILNLDKFEITCF